MSCPGTRPRLCAESGVAMGSEIWIKLDITSDTPSQVTPEHPFVLVALQKETSDCVRSQGGG